MTLYFAKSALLPDGWADDVLIETDFQGWITDIKTGVSSKGAQVLKGPVMPGMPNVHSHAFQRAMAGLTERSSGGKDNFWSWREVMYQFLGRLSPEDMQVIASQLYVEMLKAGYTTVGEFHYVHNQPDGKPYDDPLIMSHHLIRAAKDTGIGITHIPTLYAHSNFGGLLPTEGQKRFITAPDDIAGMINRLKTLHKDDPQVRIAMAYHSLRAVSSDLMRDFKMTGMPVHIHAAEQVKEVEDCLAWSGKRPVQWLLENMDIGPDWCLIHSTHMTPEETTALAKSGAVAGLCPTTEGNLGDGLFNLPGYLESAGTFGIGTDSHISINPVEELRWLEYGQRVHKRERAVAHGPGEKHVGAFLYRQALKGGAQAMGRAIGALEKGRRADWVVLDGSHPLLYGKNGDVLLDAFIFAGNVPLVRDVIVGGVQVVSEGRHTREEEIASSFRAFLDSCGEFRL